MLCLIPICIYIYIYIHAYIKFLLLIIHKVNEEDDIDDDSSYRVDSYNNKKNLQHPIRRAALKKYDIKNLEDKNNKNEEIAYAESDSDLGDTISDEGEVYSK